MLTAAGLAWLGDLMVPALHNARIYVTDGAEGKHSEIAEVTFTDKEVVFKATFGEDAANFDWKRRAIVLPDQTVIDSVDLDMGRKVMGAIWNAEHRIEFIPSGDE